MKLEWNLSKRQKQVIGDSSRYLLIEGSAGSGKTIFAAYQTVLYALKHPKARILVCRQTMPSLKETSWHEIKKILMDSEIEFHENRTEGWITLFNDCKILFRSLDDEQKIRSLSVDYIYVEQAEEIKEAVFYELRERLRGRVSEQDYGQFLMVVTPGLEKHWIYQLFHIKGVDNCRMEHFYYKDNPYLPEIKYKEYEELKRLDYDYYRKYALGKWGKLSHLIYHHETNWDKKPLIGGAEYYTAGVDFGFNNPACFLLIAWRDGEPYIIDEVHQSQLTNTQFIEKCNEMLKRHKLKPKQIDRVFADAASPDKILEFTYAGYECVGGVKDVEAKIDSVKSVQVHISENCTKTIEEIQNYVYMKDNDGNILDAPLKINDHAMDALGYAVYGTVGIRSPMVGRTVYAEGVYTY